MPNPLYYANALTDPLEADPDYPRLKLNLRSIKELHILDIYQETLAVEPVEWHCDEQHCQARVQGKAITRGQPALGWFTGSNGHPKIINFKLGWEEDADLRMSSMRKGSLFDVRMNFPKPTFLPNHNEKLEEAPDTENLSEETATDLVRWLIDQVGYAAVTRALIDAQNPEAKP